MPDKATKIIMLAGIISLLILIPIDLLTDDARPLRFFKAIDK